MKSLKDLVIAAVVIIVLVLGFNYFKGNKNKKNLVTISGGVKVHGVAKKDSTISIGEREVGNEEFVIVASGIDPMEEADWSWSEASGGTNYDIQAYLEEDGSKIAHSEILRVTAPAKNEQLTISVESDTDSKETATVKGTFDINGHIPDKATISIVENVKGKSGDRVVASGLKAVDGEAWSWKEAMSGRKYSLKAYLEETGEIVGESKTTIVTAPAGGVVLTINSDAKPPSPKIKHISGSIDLNGFVPEKSRVVILQRIKGNNDYQVAVDDINPTDGTTWKWEKASLGETYEMVAILKERNDNGTDKDIAGSHSITVKAPAKDEVFKINSGIPFPHPLPLNVNCDDQDGSSHWNVTASFDPVTDAGEYWVEVGTHIGNANLLNQKFDPSNSPEVSAKVEKNKKYYARWAYAYCNGCAEKNFSSFSDAISFTCPVKPTPTPTPSPTPKPTPTPTPFCRESLPANLCKEAGGEYRCLNGPCICVCP